MGNALAVLAKQVRDIWQHFGPSQKFSTIMALIIVASVIGGMMYWSGRPSYRLLYAGMSLEDAAAASEKIQEEKIPVKLGDSGRAIYVPEGDVYRCRLLLAKEGLPKKTSAGFELFEQPKFGLTDFAQKINYQRALAGELERTIGTMEGIASVKVNLVMPSERLFAAESEKKASASIMLNVTSEGLNGMQVKSIKQLVGSAVPGLSVSSIAITDQYGHMLAKKTETGDDMAEGGSDQIETQEKMEAMLTRKAQEMLDASLGAGKSIVRVSAVIDFSKIEKKSETYDAEGRVVASETISSESSSTPGMGSAGGGVGTTVNVGVSSPERVNVEQGSAKTKKEDINTQYKVPGGTELTVIRGARVKNISVSVSVAQGTNLVAGVVQKRTKEEIDSIENMVKTAVGFTATPERTDSIKVVEMEFPKLREDAIAKVEAGKVPWYQALPIPITSLASGLVGLIALIVVIMVSRKMIYGMSVQREEVGTPVRNLYGAGAGGAQGEPLAAGAAAGGEKELQPTMDMVVRLAEQNPRAIAAWITNVTKAQR